MDLRSWRQRYGISRRVLIERLQARAAQEGLDVTLYPELLFRAERGALIRNRDIYRLIQAETGGAVTLEDMLFREAG